MATWSELEAVFPAANRWRADLGRMPVAHLATVDGAGGPRIHPVCPHHTGGRMYVAVTSRSPKRHDLAKRGRFTIHSINVDVPGPDFDEFELAVSGTARRVGADDTDVWSAVREICPYPIPDEDWLFELPVDSALTTVWDRMDAPDRRPHRLMWREGWSGPRPPANEA